MTDAISSAPPVPETPGTPVSWVQLQSPAPRAAAPSGPIMLSTPPSATSPGTPPPPIALSAVPAEAAGQVIPGGARVAPQAMTPATRVARGGRFKVLSRGRDGGRPLNWAALLPQLALSGGGCYLFFCTGVIQALTAAVEGRPALEVSLFCALALVPATAARLRIVSRI
ncbi:unnamed protein product, partial [Prorocentrum cordatum]